jgi:hypothetical protein
MGSVAQSSGGGGDGACGRSSRDGDKPGDGEKPSSSSNSEQQDAHNDDADGVLYDESYHPPFLWALILFPPVIPLFWYVSQVGRMRPPPLFVAGRCCCFGVRVRFLQCRWREGGMDSISLDRFSHGFSYRLPCSIVNSILDPHLQWPGPIRCK